MVKPNKINGVKFCPIVRSDAVVGDWLASHFAKPVSVLIEHADFNAMHVAWDFSPHGIEKRAI